MATARRLFLAAVGLAMAATAWCATSPTSAPNAAHFPYFTFDYVLRDDASHTESYRWAREVRLDSEIAEAKQTSVTYSGSVQEATILEAYTLKKSGEKIEAPKSSYQVTFNSGTDGNSPLYSDQKTITVMLPQVEVGDTVVVAYKLDAKAPIFPGHFSAIHTFPRATAYDRVDVNYDAPAALGLRFQANQLQGGEIKAADGRQRWNWHLENKIAEKALNRGVFRFEDQPGLLVSNFKSYEDVAQAYWERAAPKAAVTPRVQVLADEIAHDAKTPTEVAKALYTWVARKITYGGNCIGFGSVVPRDIDVILDNRMGDCKDHATLLQALLAAKGIDSTQVLINANSTYALPDLPIVSIVNHVINYLPSLKLYVDSTAATVPFAMLPFADAGKPVIHADTAVAVHRTPPWSPLQNQQTMRTKLRIEPDGSVAGSAAVDVTGSFAVEVRDLMRNIKEENQDDFVKNAMASYGLRGSGTLWRDDPESLAERYRYGVDLFAKTTINLEAPGAFSINPVFGSVAPISHFLQNAGGVDDIAGEFPCAGAKSLEEFEIELPRNLHVIYLPKSATIKNDLVTYTASFRRKGRVLQVRRELIDRTVGPTCSADEIKRYDQIAKKILRNTNLMVLYTVPGS
jgi:hypothetical protein